MPNVSVVIYSKVILTSFIIHVTNQINFSICYIIFKAVGWECARSSHGFKILMAIYGSYLVLFAKFFYKTYFRGVTMEKTKKKLK